MFTFVSGNRTLDFIGTVKARRSAFDDLLTSPAELGKWLTEAGILDTAPEVGADTLRRATRLREAAWHLALAETDSAPLPAADLRIVNELAHGEPIRATLHADGSVRRTGTAEQALTEIARDAIELFGGADHSRIRECGRPECTRLYIDTSRGGSRRWCDMTICGNRAKSAAFRARQS
ncbi:CGNR zinc finger domain-containing protein [Nocardia yamanashiensis]|uniref:CGNR zinc finger domain-containing protein n=1 Tax=Nocardia yamanashiensis TaxID=209247 RepID=UPI001E4688AF|nr:CGNR zinc finger domain-containing protein [Nocardia yamanashiensis]UGT40620.1 CGNR zinc finger domain-containing protein [Nocardia yamanashiensis]